MCNMCTLYIGAIGFGLHEPFIVFFLLFVIISITFFNSLKGGQTCDPAAGFLVAGFCTCSQSAPGEGGGLVFGLLFCSILCFCFQSTIPAGKKNTIPTLLVTIINWTVSDMDFTCSFCCSFFVQFRGRQWRGVFASSKRWVAEREGRRGLDRFHQTAFV